MPTEHVEIPSLGVYFQEIDALDVVPGEEIVQADTRDDGGAGQFAVDGFTQAGQAGRGRVVERDRGGALGAHRILEHPDRGRGTRQHRQQVGAGSGVGLEQIRRPAFGDEGQRDLAVACADVHHVGPCRTVRLPAQYGTNQLIHDIGVVEPAGRPACPHQPGQRDDLVLRDSTVVCWLR